MLENESNLLGQFACGYVRGSFYKQGWKWVDQINTSYWTTSQIGKLLICLPFQSETWNKVEILLGENKSVYWKVVSVNLYEAQKDINVAIDNLIKYERPYSAIRCLQAICQEGQPIDNQRAVNALISALNSSESPNVIDTYDTIEVIKALQDDLTTNPEELFQIEWAYLPILEREDGISPLLLEQRLADNPEFFCEVIRIVYRSRKEERATEELSEQKKNIATNAYRLLHNWRIPPGSKKDGTFSGELLKQWLKHVKAECTESGHLETALITVGQVLTYSPTDPNGLWIHRSVAVVLNEKCAEYLREGFTNELFNSRGVYSFSGGKEELEFSKKYRLKADEVESQGFHRLANSLRELADSYKREAEREVSESLISKKTD